MTVFITEGTQSKRLDHYAEGRLVTRRRPDTISCVDHPAGVLDWRVNWIFRLKEEISHPGRGPVMPGKPS